MYRKLVLPLATLSLAMTATAEEAIEFSNPGVVYSAIDVQSGNEGNSLGLTIAGAVGESEWNFLVKGEVREDNDVYRVRSALINATGTGVFIDVIHDTDFSDLLKDKKSTTSVLSLMQVLPVGEKSMIVPLIGVGQTENDLAEGTTNLWNFQMMMIHNWTDNVWTNLMPKWSNSTSDMKMKQGFGDDQRIKSFEAELVTGYRFSPNENVRLHVIYNDGDHDTEFNVAYTRAF